MKLCALVLVLSTSLFVFGQDSKNPKAQFVLQKNAAVPMRDGVVLRADVMRPTEGGKFPVLVYRTPYGKDDAQQEYTTFKHAVERGYAVVIQDVRGRFHSDGDFRPYENEGRDGYDTIEWAANQPWSNGDVGTFGLSYPGAVQWLAAVQNPPHLKAMIPAMTFSTPQNFFYAGGTWDMSWIEWIWDNIAWDTRAKKNLPGPRTYEEALAAWKEEGAKMLNTLPLLDLKPLQQDPLPIISTGCGIRQRMRGGTGANCVTSTLARMQLSLIFQHGTTTIMDPKARLQTMQAWSRPGRATRTPATHLLLGPWVHGVDNTGKTRSGEREFGPTAVINYDEVVLRWMDHYLKGMSNGVDREKPVRYFVMGRNQWRDADQWPPAAKAMPAFLAPKTDGTYSGRLQTMPFENQYSFSEFVSDPALPVVNPYDSSGAHDYRKLSDRADVLTFDSAVLQEDTEVTGPIKARIFVSCDCRDFDLWARLLDVFPDGTAMNLMSPGLDVQRASYRDLSRGRQLLSPGQIYELKLENLITSNMFPQGHRVRLQISASFTPNFSRNLQSGKSEVSSVEMNKAHVRIFHDTTHPSQVLLPVIPPVR